MKPLLLFLAFCFLFFFHASVAQTQLALDGPEWENTQAFDVKGRMGLLVKQKLSFGDYFTTTVNRSWTKGSSMMTGLTSGISTDHDYRKLITVDYINKKQTVVFMMKDSTGNEAEAYCVSRFHGKDLNFGDDRVPASGRRVAEQLSIELRSSNLFYVQVYTGKDQAPWHLVLDNEEAQQAPKSYQALLTQGNERFYRIVPDSRIRKGNGKAMNMPFGSAGFKIMNASGEPVAAVSMIDKGVVYLKSVDPQERILLSTVCSALLLQEQI